MCVGWCGRSHSSAGKNAVVSESDVETKENWINSTHAIPVVDDDDVAVVVAPVHFLSLSFS